MPKMDQTGPGNKGRQTGRGLGKCSDKSTESLLQKLGRGMGLRRKQGGGKGQGKRLQS